MPARATPCGLAVPLVVVDIACHSPPRVADMGPLLGLGKGRQKVVGREGRFGLGRIGIIVGWVVEVGGHGLLDAERVKGHGSFLLQGGGL